LRLFHPSVKKHVTVGLNGNEYAVRNAYKELGKVMSWS
jgi:hypothetical protein